MADEQLARAERAEAEQMRLRAALKVCEDALHRTAIIGGAPATGEDADRLHAAQQAAGAWANGWRPGQQQRDDSPEPNWRLDPDGTVTARKRQ